MPIVFSSNGKPSPFLKIYLFAALFAVFFTALLAIIFHSFFNQNKVNLVNKLKVNRGEIEYHYNDFDHDGFSEYLIFKNVFTGQDIGVKFYTSKDQLIDQWNFPEAWLPDAVYFTDYDNDGYDEVYFFTLAHDSLFLYAFDPRYRNKFLIYRKFIVRKPEPNPHPQRKWDIRKPNAVFYDSNNDGFKEAYFILMTGFSMQPRRIFKFDIRSKKIVAKSPFAGAYLGSPFLFDLNKDKIPELILGGSSAPDNYDQPVPFRDNVSWLMVFNLDLNFFFEPIEFPYYPSSLATLVWKREGQNYLISYQNQSGPLDVPPVLSLYNFKGELLRQRKLDPKIFWTIFSFPENTREHLYLANNKGEISELGSDLKPVKTYRLEHSFLYSFFEFDFDRDMENEYFGSGTDGYLIVERDFRSCYLLRDYLPSSSDFFSINKRGHSGAQIIIQNASTLNAFQYSFNTWYSFRYFILSFTAVLVYLILLALFFRMHHRFSQKQIHRQLFQFSPLGLLVLDLEGKIRFLNGNFEQSLKLTRHIREKEYFEEALEERPEIIRFISELVKSLKLTEKEISLKLAGGIKHFLMKGMVIKGLFQVPAGFLIEIIPYDNRITDNRLQIWTKTVQKMAHDIKTPLSTIQLSFQTLKLKLQELLPESGETIKNDLILIDRELNRVREMTKHFLRFTNLEKPKIKAVSIEQIINSSIKKFERYLNSQLKINIELDPSIKIIYADPVLIEMVFQILIENSIDAMEGKGIILIETNLIENPEENFQKYIEIEVADSGPGIEEENIEKVFQPFFTTKSDGTGMGLTLARKIIEDHLGNISLSSRKGFATVIRILLPLKQEPIHDNEA